MIFKFAGRLAALGLVGMLAAGVHAQTAVLNFASNDGSRLANGGGYTKFTFTDSMIVNSIGFVTNVAGQPFFPEYAISGGDWKSLFGQLGTPDSNDVAWYDFSTGLQVNAGDSIQIYGAIGGGSGQYAGIDLLDAGVSQVAGVRFDGYTGQHNGGSLVNNKYIATGNIKVTNPGSNVAPEPGTFALALTGGGALLGICVRRRRSAA